MRGASKIRFLNVLSFSLSSVALLAVIWIIVPAPSAYLWLFSVAASEWSLWFGATALLGVACALAARIFRGAGKLWVASFVIGSIAFVISLYPLFSVISVAREQNVSLSLKRYFNGFSEKINHSSENKSQNFTTYTFAQTGAENLQADVYSPTKETANNGASIVVVHGGAWSGGARNDFPQWNSWLAAQGFTVFDIDYRLASPNYSTANDDVQSSIRWVKDNSGKFNVSPDRIALFGRSAGAHLALLAAYSAGDARFSADFPPATTSASVRAVVSFYAPTDLLWDFDNPANQSVIDGPQTLADFLGGRPGDSAEMRERYISASPVARVGDDTPPTLLVHGGRDQLVRAENMRLLAERLSRADVPSKTIFIPYAQHGFDYNFNGWGAQISQPAILNFLGEYTKQR